VLTCPYCYNRFREKEILFRCAGRPAPGRPVCVASRDGRLEHWLDDSRPMRPVFSANGRRLRASCPHCLGETTHQVCPHCHSELPVHFSKVDSRMIALIGAKDSGKTVYMTVLIHELMHRLGRELDVAVTGGDDETRDVFSRDYDERLYTGHALPETTDPASARATRPRPLVFRMTTDRRRAFQRAHQQTVLSFFDTAGEDLTSEESVEQNVRYLENADGIILLVDPLQMPGARRQARPGTPMPELGRGGNDYDRPSNVLTRVTQLLMRHGGRAETAIDKPIAVAFTKLDALEHLVDRGSPLDPRLEAPILLHEQDSQAVHEQARALFDDWEGPQLDQHVRKMYRTYRYFGLSALGNLPTAQRTVASVQPYRVADPFLWLLSEFGTVPANKG
jgi:hypothetical protein